MKVGEVSVEQKEVDEGEFFIDRELDLQFSSMEVTEQSDEKDSSFPFDK